MCSSLSDGCVCQTSDWWGNNDGVKRPYYSSVWFVRFLPSDPQSHESILRDEFTPDDCYCVKMSKWSMDYRSARAVWLPANTWVTYEAENCKQLKHFMWCCHICKQHVEATGRLGAEKSGFSGTEWFRNEWSSSLNELSSETLLLKKHLTLNVLVPTSCRILL